MNTGSRYSTHAIFGGLRRKPVLTAMMVTSLIYGVTASVAGIAVWKASSKCVIAQSSASPNIPQMAIDVAGRGSPTMDSESTPVGESASASCPCSASNEWHWQRI
jgi:hypothetical protein